MTKPSPPNNHTILKCIEELNELATVLIQQHNKPTKDMYSKIQDEIADVKHRIGQIEQYYDQSAINARINRKWGGKCMLS